MQETGLGKVRLDELAASKLQAHIIVDIGNLELIDDGDGWIVGVRGRFRCSKQTVFSQIRRARAIAWSMLSFVAGWLAANHDVTWWLGHR